jgi:hypothetical protein
MDSSIDRSLLDEEQLTHIAELIHNFLDQLAPELHPLESKYSRWQPGDLVDALHEQLNGIRFQLALLRMPPEADDDD